ncbi:MAG: carboxy terminal-processing peptidase [Chitinophaga sp.]|uniref:carboxy terminal-processing peptidase n=1 Tax=Chitinophaga sp. TaxID=1869181 RepID=UPI001B21B255|nr:carboxy terminal-processing peptidase [Chitinophaga sp.]MBO9732119.1 carboxy terminal-processing peptidase [Chitinophaga sp.]
MKVCQGTKILLLFAAAAFTGSRAIAQSRPSIPINIPAQPTRPVIPPIMEVSQPGYRGAAIASAFRKIKRDHFDFKGVNDTYSQQVWEKFIHVLDPNNVIFLQEDIQQLGAYKNSVDDEINSGASTFFDAAYAIYSKRIRETETICMRILQQPFNMQQKESVDVTWNKSWPFPANEQAREDLWRRYLKYYTLRHYMEGDTSAAQPVKTFNKALEAKARETVRKWYAEYFRQCTSKDAMKEKFAQYMSVVVGEVDPHSSYTAPDDRSWTEMLTKRYYGLGIELGAKEADFIVKRMMPGGTAYKSGEVKENDIVVAIMDNHGVMVPVNGMDASHVTSMIRGDKGTSVTLTLQQPGEQARTVTLKRDEVLDTENRTRSALIEKNGKKYGYIYLPSFYLDPTGTGLKGCANDVWTEIEKLKENEIDGIIMDLRGNPGGALHEVVRMCAGFVPSSPVSWLRSKDSLQQYTSPDITPLYDGPLTVMVDEGSASASEIFAAAMQDLGRGIIIGTSSTFGKGTAQSGFPMGKLGDAAKNIPDTAYGTLNLTLQKFYRISGTATQLNGVTPDIILQKRMSLESIMEKDYSSALPNDTLQLLPFEKVKSKYDFRKVIQLANDRVKATPALMDIDNTMAQLKTLRNKTMLLNLEDFRKEYSALSGCEKRIQQDRLLPAGHTLNVQPALLRSINPATLKTTPGEELRSKEWLEKLSKDIYLDQTVSVLEDMLANQL